MTKFGINLKDTKQMMAVAALIGFAALYLYVKFLLLPQIQGVVKHDEATKKISAQVKVTEREISEIEGLKKQVELYRGKIDSYERMLPAEQEIPKLLEDLSDMAKNANVKIVGITPLALAPRQEPRPDDIYQEIPILINARSGYHELGKFASDLENSDRFMKIVDLNIKENKATPKKHDVSLWVLTYKLTRNK